MMTLVNMDSPGLKILATHRLVNGVPNFQGQTLLARLREHFDLTPWPFDTPQSKAHALDRLLQDMKRLAGERRNAFGLYCGGPAFHTAVLRDKQAMSPAWRALDLSVLHKLILEPGLGLTEEELAEGDHVTYVKDTPTAVQDSIAQVDQGRQQVAFLTNPVLIDDLIAVTDAGERMPHKSTYFYPKMYTGLAIQKL